MGLLKLAAAAIRFSVGAVMPVGLRGFPDRRDGGGFHPGAAPPAAPAEGEGGDGEACGAEIGGVFLCAADVRDENLAAWGEYSDGFGNGLTAFVVAANVMNREARGDKAEGAVGIWQLGHVAGVEADAVSDSVECRVGLGRGDGVAGLVGGTPEVDACHGGVGKSQCRHYGDRAVPATQVQSAGASRQFGRCKEPVPQNKLATQRGVPVKRSPCAEGNGC